MRKQEIDLKTLSFDERLKHAPYEVFVQTEGEESLKGNVQVSNVVKDGITYSIIKQHKGVGYFEIATIGHYGRAVLHSAIIKWGDNAQLEMLQEEATELALACRKWLRKGDIEEYQNLAEEIADVEILIDQISLMYRDIRPLIQKHRDYKMRRLERRVNGDDFEGE